MDLQPRCPGQGKGCCEQLLPWASRRGGGQTLSRATRAHTWAVWAKHTEIARLVRQNSGKQLQEMILVRA